MCAGDTPFEGEDRTKIKARREEEKGCKRISIDAAVSKDEEGKAAVKIGEARARKVLHRRDSVAYARDSTSHADRTTAAGLAPTSATVGTACFVGATSEYGSWR